MFGQLALEHRRKRQDLNNKRNIDSGNQRYP